MQCKGCKCRNGAVGLLNEKNIQNFFYFKEKPYLCKPKQTITRKLLERESEVTKTFANNNNNKVYTEMKKGIHPENYRPVVFKDMSNGDMFLSRSTCATNTSHPFYTGKSKLVDTAGRVDKFMSRYNRIKK